MKSASALQAQLCAWRKASGSLASPSVSSITARTGPDVPSCAPAGAAAAWPAAPAAPPALGRPIATPAAAAAGQPSTGAAGPLSAATRCCSSRHASANAVKRLVPRRRKVAMPPLQQAGKGAARPPGAGSVGCQGRLSRESSAGHRVGRRHPGTRKAVAGQADGPVAHGRAPPASPGLWPQCAA